jgi:HK97 family phage major capsid protein
MQDELKAALADVLKTTEGFGERLEQVKSESATTRHMLIEVAQKYSRGGGGGDYTSASWGAQFVAADGLKHFAADASRPSRFRLDVTEVKTTLTGGDTSGGPLGDTARGPVALMARRPLRVRDLLPVVQISTNSVEWPAQTARPTAAATVAEGGAKPQSSAAFALRTANTQVIAHWLAASRQILDDAPQLRDVIDGELRYGLAITEEAQLLNGDGNSPNLHGLIPQATAFADPLAGDVTDPNEIDRIGSAILQAALADYPATGIVLHPSDWQKMRLLKDADGLYVLGQPGIEVEPRLFGLPVVATKAIAAGSFLVGDFASAATIYDRWTPRVEISTEHSDFFTRNLVAILAEQRIALAVRHPGALITGTFGA